MPRMRSGRGIMPERVMGILDDPQRILAIFLGRKAQNALWAVSIHSLNAHNTFCAFFARKLPERVVGHLKCPERVVALFFSHNALWAFFFRSMSEFGLCA